MTSTDRLHAARVRLTEALELVQSAQGADEDYASVALRGEIARCVKQLSNLITLTERTVGGSHPEPAVSLGRRRPDTTVRFGSPGSTGDGEQPLGLASGAR